MQYLLPRPLRSTGPLVSPPDYCRAGLGCLPSRRWRASEVARRPLPGFKSTLPRAPSQDYTAEITLPMCLSQGYVPQATQPRLSCQGGLRSRGCAGKNTQPRLRCPSYTAKVKMSRLRGRACVAQHSRGCVAKLMQPRLRCPGCAAEVNLPNLRSPGYVNQASQPMSRL